MRAHAENSKTVHQLVGASGNRTYCGITLYNWRVARTEVTCKRCLKKMGPQIVPDGE